MMCQSYFEPAISTIRTFWWTYPLCTDDKTSFILGTKINLFPDCLFLDFGIFLMLVPFLHPMKCTHTHPNFRVAVPSPLDYTD